MLIKPKPGQTTRVIANMFHISHLSIVRILNTLRYKNLYVWLYHDLMEDLEGNIFASAILYSNTTKPTYFWTEGWQMMKNWLFTAIWEENVQVKTKLASVKGWWWCSSDEAERAVFIKSSFQKTKRWIQKSTVPIGTIKFDEKLPELANLNLVVSTGQSQTPDSS